MDRNKWYCDVRRVKSMPFGRVLPSTPACSLSVAPWASVGPRVAPAGVGRRRRRCSPCHQYLRYPASHCHSPNFREIRRDLLSHRISSDSTSRFCANLKSHEPTNIHQISLRSVETCSPTGSQPIQHLVSGRVPEIQIPVRKRDSPDFSEFRRLSLASTDIEENPASGDLSTDIG
ncbi:uncharacterized protein MEPE_05064 [Melanopsichium pennsylvanicum]|uniref:Uncharacterized protein n=1 Tax=Melanopsichium pennsylvanicum TaxID=63383 RepID=A0AAJ5C6Y7_9BASI|nr:uncharacterized protein MEPE_05064 [Melanopsichium pennsylvanicum]